jgi:hypothetical protein
MNNKEVSPHILKFSFLIAVQERNVFLQRRLSTPKSPEAQDFPFVDVQYADGRP